ncbi:hypothetical protein KGM_204985 [Danaus plexippus plexippus]|uniref:Uncharacterized protein n=1 Tax=Danaus plexippus plexippus TaxID=278856 RepID=A0A212FAK0_DANPL|nr:hypothetical protein KGM_204985 [Danaus plexippus plexippus]
MWKYVSRRIRDTCERANIRSSAVISSSNNVTVDRKNTTSNTPCRWFILRKCCNYQSDYDTKSKRWNFDELNRTWIGAITWSSALVFGWYTSQLLHLKFKNKNDDRAQPQPVQSKSCFLDHFGCLINSNKKYLKPLEINGSLDNSVEKTPIVHLVTNDHAGGDKQRLNSCSTDSGTADDDLGEVLNSIENRLGLAAIENGQHQDGLNLLRSAANRNHAPALYNLGLCYEIGVGVDVDERTAMEMYRLAATLHHPDALYNLGIYYGQGRGGLVCDQAIATRLLRLAAIQGHKNAIEALKTLNIDISEKPPERDGWTKQFSPFVKESNILPSHTNLFVDNVGISHYNYEPIVF